VVLVRILVDGYSLLHAAVELIQDHSPFSQTAREALIRLLTRYRDAVGVPVTVFFDGSGRVRASEEMRGDHALEILYSKNGRTADDMIERAAFRLLEYGDVLVVTDDLVERGTVQSFGAMGWSCDHFLREVERALADAASDLQRYNQSERKRFKRNP
jgi:uncharacterized protein